MKVTFLAALFFLSASCSAPAEGGRDPSQKMNEPFVIDSATGQMAGEWGKGRKIRYQTARNIRDPRELRPEAESLWAEFRAAAEADSVCTVELEASAPASEARMPVGGTVFARRNFSFIVRRDSANTWRWLTSAEPPVTPCFE